ncbi:type II toxin-antitoxin system prevent-host-death family antitoxin [Desulfobacterales bacterium HSG17]|nr:type II toxin-antitoxin system prevent-host-death family antitoxin [Desulfobacterales bacterium HSG17]
MENINVRETRQHIGRILDAVVTGKEFIITRRNTPVAKLSGIHKEDIKSLCFPHRDNFRAKLPKNVAGSSRLIREMRDERG